MHAVTRAAGAAVRAGARAQSTAVAPAAGAAGQASFMESMLFDAPRQNSLDETFPGVPAISGELAAPTKVQVSKLPNGLTVVSQDSHRGASTVGVYLKGGSRTETVPGTAFAAQQLAFKSTQKRSALKLFRDVDVVGGTLSAVAGRETLAYTASGTRDCLPLLTEAVAETLTAPKLDAWELDENAAWTAAQLAAAQAAPGAAIAQAVHAAAFGEASPLGKAPATAGQAGVEDVKAYLSAHVQGKNAVLAGVNVDHAQLVEAGDLLLLGVPEGAPAKFEAVKPRGGEFVTRTDAGVTEVGLGFAVTGLDAKATLALQVLQAALGVAPPAGLTRGSAKTQISDLLAKIKAGDTALPAGSTVSSGVYTYSDAALFTLTGATAGQATGAWLDTVVALLKEVAGGKLTDAEVNNAKKVATLKAVGAVDGIHGLSADMGAQLALTGKYLGAGEQAAAFAGVKTADVAAAAKSVLAGTVGLAATGNAAALPRYDALLTSLL